MDFSSACARMTNSSRFPASIRLFKQSRLGAWRFRDSWTLPGVRFRDIWASDSAGPERNMIERRANPVGRAATANVPRISLGGLRLAVLDLEQTADFMIDMVFPQRRASR